MFKTVIIGYFCSTSRHFPLVVVMITVAIIVTYANWLANIMKKNLYPLESKDNYVKFTGEKSERLAFFYNKISDNTFGSIFVKSNCLC